MGLASVMMMMMMMTAPRGSESFIHFIQRGLRSALTWARPLQERSGRLEGGQNAVRGSSQAPNGRDDT